MPGRGETALIGAGEPPACTVLNPSSETALLLVCDHASGRMPRVLDGLGLDPGSLRSHLAVDIGAGTLTRSLATRLGASAVLANYSRLVVDCNRDLLDPAAFLEYGDGVVVPGNRGLADAEKKARADAFYRPYHRTIANQLARLRAAGRRPAVVAIHSFTPVLDGVSRPWEFGILWDADRPTAGILIRELRAAGYVVGDNEPYSGKAPQDYTIDHHAEAAGLPHAGIEVRQDLIADEAGALRVASVLAGIFAKLPYAIFSADAGAEAAPGGG